MALREIFAELGFGFKPTGFIHAEAATDKIKGKAKEAAVSFDDLAEHVGSWAAILSTGLLGEWTKSIGEQADQIGDVSEAVGINTHMLQAWNLAARENGINAEEFALSLRKLASAAAGGADETGSQSKIFDKLKIKTKDASGAVRGLGDLLPEIAEHFKNTEDGAAKAALAQELFGRQGNKLIPILNQGAAGVANLSDEFDKLGGGFSEETIKQAGELEKQIGRMSVAFDSFKNLIGLNVFPIINSLLDKTTELTAVFSKFAKNTTLGEHAVGALSTALAVKLGSAILPYLGTGLKFAAVFLAVDDLLAFLDGKDSVIGDLLNRAFGDGTATQVREWAADAIDSFGGWLEAFKVVIPDIGVAFEQQFDRVRLGWDGMILSFEEGWNEFVAKLHLPNDLKFDPLERRSKQAKDQQILESDTARRAQTTAAVQNYASATTALSNPGGGFSPTGPVRAPIVTQNFVEVKPNISITVPPGTSAAHAQRLVREAAAGTVAHERRVAMQAVDKRGGE